MDLINYLQYFNKKKLKDNMIYMRDSKLTETKKKTEKSGFSCGKKQNCCLLERKRMREIL